jgi:hypothetical protein
MSKSPWIVSATFVWFLLAQAAFASPSSKWPEASPEPAKEAVPKALDENMILSAPPALKENPEPPSAPYYPYLQALTVRSGNVSDFPKLGFGEGFIGAQYLYPRFLSPKLEIGADLHPDGRGHIHAGLRTIYFERSLLRPSVKLGVDHFLDSKNGIASLGDTKAWFVRGSAIVERVLLGPVSLRLDAELLANFRTIKMEFSLGLSYGL